MPTGTRAASNDRKYDGVKVFSATMVARRERLGDEIADWLRAHPERVPVEAAVRLSSDARFHCLSILIFWWTTTGS